MEFIHAANNFFFEYPHGGLFILAGALLWPFTKKILIPFVSALARYICGVIYNIGIYEETGKTSFERYEAREKEKNTLREDREYHRHGMKSIIWSLCKHLQANGLDKTTAKNKAFWSLRNEKNGGSIAYAEEGTERYEKLSKDPIYVRAPMFDTDDSSQPTPYY